MKTKKETTDRFPTWWLFYYVLRKAYFFLGIPFFLFCGVMSITGLIIDPYYGKDVNAYFYILLWWFLLLAPGIWMYSRAKTRREKIRKVVQTIKESGFYSPEKGYEGLSLTQGAYFGIDLKNGTMLYVRIYPGNIMDVIGFDIHNFTRTVTDDKKLEIHTKYINLPMVPVPSWCAHPETASNTMHAMASRGYDYPVDFPRLIQEKRKEWEQIAGMPVAEVF
ncbi:plasmid IncI1-type surface exclusion protein ExcA [Salmonella enterica]|uniref:plasmid IncI1-type surface exclusion protein ExcA n=1 Tax=Escherichia coli TaxID=562 RepID=UPI001DB2DE5E|nr:plasmid IncI1-type surface exclusion protein ExcA [Salmonella enterica subsp. enterica serovar Saintpaul]EHQ9425702.1 plasmid IncI1-type surface exclusion protein ExcA [Salmonella enterica]EJP7914784.1 plasmid IncI1-type surface exclusion protein ExcA [Escherichia coli]HBM7518764.1 plasmid IncI1-type surface exclusion protein ExcA [Escherichia coli]